MGEPTFWERVRSWIGGIAFDVFLWSMGMTNRQYLQSIQMDEKGRKINRFILGRSVLSSEYSLLTGEAERIAFLQKHFGYEAQEIWEEMEAKK